MRRGGITFDDVAEAAETLQTQGENPTIDRVRVFLGGTGSNTTISKYLNTWRGQFPSFQPSENLLTPPDPVQVAVKKVWQQIREETDAEIQAIKSEKEALVVVVENKAYTAIKQAEHLQIVCNELQEQVNLLQANKEIQLLDFKKIQEEHALLQERYKGLDERHVELQKVGAKHQEEIINAHKNEINLLIEKSKAQEFTFQKLIDELKIHNEDQRQRHILEIDTLKLINQKLEKDLNLLQTAITSKDLQLLESKIQLGTVIKERNDLITQLPEKEKYRELIENNTQVINKLLLSIKKQAKVDFNLSYISYFNEFQKDILISIEKFGKNTDEVKTTLEKLLNEKYLNTNNE